MQLDASLPWLARGLTPGLASRLSARVLRQFGSPEGVFRASKRDLEACQLPSEAAEAVLKRKAFPRAEKELAAVRKVDGCSLVNWTEPGIPPNAAANLRPASSLICPRGPAGAEPAAPQHCGNQETDGLRHTDGAEARV